MIGSLLRCIYSVANNPEEVESITQSVYATLLGAIVAPVVKAIDPKSGSEADYGLSEK